MKILRKADQIYIAKRLAAICYIAVHWNTWNTNDIEFIEKVLNNVADIAFRVGGMGMMERDVPRLVTQLEKQFGNFCPNCNAKMGGADG